MQAPFLLFRRQCLDGKVIWYGPPCRKPGPLLRICNWVGHLSQGTKNNVKRGPEKNRNFEKSKNRKIEKIEKSKNRNFADRNFLFDYFSIFHCPEREGKGIAEILRKEYWNKD